MADADLVANAIDLARRPLPRPGAGETAQRLQELCDLGRRDLALAKVVEPHHDAAAICADLDMPPPVDGSLWAVWAAEPPFARLTADRVDGAWTISGTKAFCSGATFVTDALVTADAVDGSRLFAVDMAGARRSGRVSVSEPDWVGTGMRAADTRTARVHDLDAVAVGPPRGYLDRPGFWHGAVGVAACWYGGARGVVDLLSAAGGRGRLDEHGLAQLGAATAALDAGWAQLERTAAHIDADPHDEHGRAQRMALSVRSTVDAIVEQVICLVGRALGPGPLAFDADHAQRVADLQVFVRQHHAERDLAELGRLVGLQDAADG